MSDPPHSSAPRVATIPGTAPAPRHARTLGETLPSSDAMPSAAQPTDTYVRATLDGRYEVEALLGEGGMGFVYAGRHKVIGKRVAIKILRSDHAADPVMTERFLNEAKAASSIGSPHVVDISDFGRLPDGAAFFVMEFLDGVTLSTIMRRTGVVAVGRIVHIAKQIARGIAAAHARKIVHRDLKPDNVMLVTQGEERDFVKILDFGIAKIGHEAARLTRAGTVFGTPHYMSPEQAAGVAIDHRTDIYSLGVVLYEMASGKVPFDADSLMGILTQHMYRAPAPIRAVVPQSQDVPPGLEAIVLKCLSKNVDFRYPSMDALIADLEKLERGAAPAALTETVGRSGGFAVPVDYFRPSPALAGSASEPAREPRRAGALVGALAGGVVVLGVLGASLVVASSRAKPEPGASERAPEAAVSAAASPDSPPPASAAEPAPHAADRLAVTITTEPVDATVALDDGADAPQQQPRTITIGAEEKVALRIERPGYTTKVHVLDVAELDRAKPRVEIRLEREPPAGAAPAASAKRAPGAPPSAPPGNRAPPKPSASAPPPAPTLTARPSWCSIEDWDVFAKKCTKR